MTKTKKASPLSEDQFFKTDAELVEADKKRVLLKEEAAEFESRSRKIGAKVIATLKARGTKKIVHQGWRITLVTPQKVEYDYPALLRLLTPAQKRRIVRRTLTVDLMALDSGQIAALKRVLGRKYRANVTEEVDPDAVSQAVQDGVIDADTVASVSNLVDLTAYVTSGATSE